MAVTITDTRTIIDEADSTTGWTSPVAAEAISLITSDPSPIETSGSLGMAVSGNPVQVSEIIHTLDAATDLADTLIYVWILANGTMDTQANGGIALVVGDAAELTGYHLAGVDVAAFRHAVGPVGWQCLILDTSQTPTTNFTDLQGAEVDLDFTNVTRVGAMYTTLSKALGGAENCFTDIMRYGNDGLIITDGTSGDTGKFSELSTEDRASTNQQAYGIIREVISGVFGLQGPLTFGDNQSGGAATFFADTDVTVVFEDRGIATDKYFMNIVGNGTGSTTFRLGTKVGDQGGSNGCSIIVPAGIGASWDSSDADLESLLLYGSSLIGFEGGMTFSSDATNAPNHEIMACTFSGNGLITIGLTEFKNNTIAASTNAGGSVLIDSTTNVSDLVFTSGGSGHAINIDTAGTYTLTNFSYAGFGSNDTADASFLNNSGGLVTLNISGGTAPTVRNTGGGSDTDIVNTKSIDFHVEDTNGNGIDGAQVYIQKQTPTAQFSGAGNSAGDPDLEVSSVVDADIPTAGWVIVYDKSENATLPYRYESVSGSTLTLISSAATGTCDAGGSSTTLLDAGAFTGTVVLAGDTIRNTTDGSWAVVDQVVSTGELLTSPLRGGTNTWGDGDTWSVHDLATALAQNVDTVDIPLVNAQTKSDASGDINTVSFSLGSAIPVSIRIRSNEGATKYIPFVTSGTISDNFAGSAVIQEDTVAT